MHRWVGAQSVPKTSPPSEIHLCIHLSDPLRVTPNNGKYKKNELMKTPKNCQISICVIFLKVKKKFWYFTKYYFWTFVFDIRLFFLYLNGCLRGFTTIKTCYTSQNIFWRSFFDDFLIFWKSVKNNEFGGRFMDIWLENVAVAAARVVRIIICASSETTDSMSIKAPEHHTASSVCEKLIFWINIDHIKSQVLIFGYLCFGEALLKGGFASYKNSN